MSGPHPPRSPFRLPADARDADRSALWIGLAVLGPWTVADVSKISVAYYFGYFLLALPLLGKFEKTRPLPNSISEAVLKPAPATT